ncbi:uncharacterized protein LOC127770926, partial [Oryza glaberrima]
LEVLSFSYSCPDTIDCWWLILLSVGKRIYSWQWDFDSVPLFSRRFRWRTGSIDLLIASSSEESKEKAVAEEEEKGVISPAATETAGEKKASAAAAGEETKKKQKEKKMKKVRMPQHEVDRIMSYKHRPLTMPPGYKNFSKELLACFPVPVDQLDDYWARKNKIHDEGAKPILEEQERIRKEYKEKGYAEYWITDDEDQAATRSRAPAPGRRRGRPGVTKKHTGGTKKL